MKTIMVTGASGYLGRHVVEALISSARFDKVVAVDVVDRGVDAHAEFRCGDLLRDTIFQASLPVPDVLLHLAWQDGFVHNSSTHLTSLSAHYSFLKIMADRGVKQIAVMGTMHEVGYFEGMITDDVPCVPFSLYGIAKNALRQALFVEFAKKDVCFQWLRGFYIYGDDANNHSIFTKLLTAAAEGKKEFPFTSGKNKYDFIDIRVLAKQIVATVSQTAVTGIVNCCSGEPKSLGEVVEKFIVDHNLDIKLKYGAFPDRPYDSPAIWGDNGKILKILSGL